MQALRQDLFAVFEGSATGIHDARVATRRLREVLPLATDQYPESVVEDCRGRLAAGGRRLGEVRDADVRIDLLLYLEKRLAGAATSLARLRLSRQRERNALLRGLLKALEKLELGPALEHAQSSRKRGMLIVRNSGEWRPLLRAQLIERAEALEAALDHATGVYFPNRLHRTRVAIKKFRYTAEVYHWTGLGEMTRALRQLRKAQSTIGEIHDRQMLGDELDRGEDSTLTEAHDRDAIQQFLDAERDDLHSRFLARRPELRAICAATHRRGHGRLVAVPVTAAAAVAVSSVVRAWHRRTA
jgi:CHAD domain-containing protein